MHEDDASLLRAIVKGLLGVLAGGIVLTGLGMWGCPQYKVYEQTRAGEAKLRESEFSRRALVEEARAKKDSAVFQADAEITRARGVAEANKIIGESLKSNESYLRYLYITSLQDHGPQEKTTVIYIPTEAGMPILEAGTRHGSSPSQVEAK